MSSINCLNSSFRRLKYCIKYEFIDWIVNNIWLVQKFTCRLKTYKTCKPMVRFSKYEFNNNILSGVTLLRVTLDITLTQPNIYIYIYIQINALDFFLFEAKWKKSKFCMTNDFFFLVSCRKKTYINNSRITSFGTSFSTTLLRS